jgi:hypothetical protein
VVSFDVRSSSHEINVSTPEEVCFFGTTAAAQKRENARSSRNQAVLGLTARDWVPPQENEINTAKRQIGFAPVDLLYSVSLTKSTKKYHEKAKCTLGFKRALLIRSTSTSYGNKRDLPSFLSEY